MNRTMYRGAAALVAAAMLASCGGGGGDTASEGPGTVVLSGQVVDAPIAGAQVCLFSDGELARTSAGEAICSAETDAQGNYSITIPRNLAPGLVTLVASKGTNIKLASALGTLAQVLETAGGSGTLTPANLPNARVTHFTTADFVLADIDNDGKVSRDELDSYVSDFANVRKVAAVIKAVVDFEGQAGSLIGGQTTDTLALAKAAANNQPLGTSNKTADEWLSDPDNANIVAAVNQDVAKDVEGSFSNYQLSLQVTSHYIPPVVERNGGASSIYCGVNTDSESETVEIALDAARRLAVLKFAEDDGEDGQMVGTFDPETGKVILIEDIPKEVVQSNPTSGITFYSEGHFKLIGTFSATTGTISGTFDEMVATTWTLDATRQECTASGAFTATKL